MTIMKDSVARCHLIASVLVADGIMTNHERAFLSHAMAGLGLSDEEKEQVVTFSEGDRAYQTIAKLPEDERRAILDELVAAALADGKLSPYETQVVEELTEKLGFSEG